MIGLVPGAAGTAEGAKQRILKKHWAEGFGKGTPRHSSRGNAARLSRVWIPSRMIVKQGDQFMSKHVTISQQERGSPRHPGTRRNLRTADRHDARGQMALTEDTRGWCT